jgi:glycosyltransferase involved in cell wall biosynthesis
VRRALFVGRARYGGKLSLANTHKFAAVGRVLDYRVVGSALDGELPRQRFRLMRRARFLEGPRFYATLPLVLIGELRRFRPDAVIAQSPYEGLAALLARFFARSRAKVIVEIHGDWQTATRLYGSPLRALAAPLADRFAPIAVRHADGVRTVGPFTGRLVRQLGVEPLASFHGFTDTEQFTSTAPAALPDQPRLAFVGVLERYKNVDGLAEAWRLAAPRLPGVTLELVGDGRRTDAVRALQRDVPGQVVWHRRLAPMEVAALLDRSWALVLPSFSEGLPRIALEALARGRPVVGSRAGGIPDAVQDGVNGVLVTPGDPEELADALVGLLRDPTEVRRLADAAKPSVERILISADEYAERLAALVERVCER